ncbi:MAG TPA: tetratricopeptide repeat protein [Coleofasciculaceae cyanobacterium]
MVERDAAQNAVLVEQESATAEFLGYNLEALSELASFVDFSEGFTIAFAEINFSGDAVRVMAALRRHPACADIQLAEIVLDDPELKDPLKALRQRVEILERQADRKLVLVVQGLEKSIGMMGESSIPVLRNLNYDRDQFPAQIPHPIIFVLPDYALQRLAKVARDFWSWASAVVRFRSAPQTLSDARMQTLDPQRLLSSDLTAVKQERIDQLLRLLTEYTPSPGQAPLQDAELRLNLLEELGDAYNSVSHLRQAKHYYQRFLELAEATENLSAQADGLLQVGQILFRLDDQSQTALAYYDRARSLYQSLKNSSGEANTLRAIGDVLQFLKRSTEALENYDQAIGIYRQVGDRLGEANTLRAIGDVLQFLKRSTEALENYDQAIGIYRQVGSTLGEANTLKAIGNVLQFLKRSTEALENYDQAIGIYRQVGARLGEANTLKAIGDVLQFLKQSSDALANYQQAIGIYRQVGDRLGEANTLAEFGNLHFAQGEYEQALPFQQQRLAMMRDIGDKYSEAAAQYYIGRTLAQLDQIPEAIQAYASARDICREIQLENLVQLCQEAIDALS